MSALMSDLIEALQIFLKYAIKDVYSPTQCAHDTLYIFPGVHHENMDPEDVARLDDLGFHPSSENEGSWYSYRFGSC